MTLCRSPVSRIVWMTGKSTTYQFEWRNIGKSLMNQVYVLFDKTINSQVLPIQRLPNHVDLNDICCFIFRIFVQIDKCKVTVIDCWKKIVAMRTPLNGIILGKVNVTKWAGYCLIRFFWIVNQIQIHHKYVIDNPNQIFKMVWQSNPKPITIQRYRTANIIWPFLMLIHWISQETSLTNLWHLKILIKSSLASLLEHDALWNLNFLIKWFWYFGFGLKWLNWIENSNPKSNFDFGLSITIQSTKMDFNPDWAIQSSNTMQMRTLTRTFCVLIIIMNQ